MADGEIAVSVQAEGTEDAVGEMGGGPEVGGGGAAGVGWRGGDGGSGGKVLGKLLTRILGLLAFLGPILDVIKVMTDIITAFVAPLAVMLLRILKPVMILLLKILPFWLSFMSFVNDQIPKIMGVLENVLVPLLLLRGILALAQRLPGLMEQVKARLADARDRIGEVVSGIMDLPGRIWSFVQQLPDQIVSGLSSILPGVGEIGGPVGEGIDRAREFLSGDSGDGRDRSVLNLAISGGLSPFIEQIEQNGSVDFP